VVPADDKRNARLIISRIIVSTLRALKMEYPKPTPQRRREMLLVRKLLAK